MIPVAVAFRRWRAAEQDAGDATRLMLWMAEAGDADDLAGQQAVVRKLRQDAHELLHKYFNAVQLTGSRSGYVEVPLPHQSKKSPHKAQCQSVKP